MFNLKRLDTWNMEPLSMVGTLVPLLERLADEIHRCTSVDVWKRMISMAVSEYWGNFKMF